MTNHTEFQEVSDLTLRERRVAPAKFRLPVGFDPLKATCLLPSFWGWWTFLVQVFRSFERLTRLLNTTVTNFFILTFRLQILSIQ